MNKYQKALDSIRKEEAYYSNEIDILQELIDEYFAHEDDTRLAYESMQELNGYTKALDKAIKLLVRTDECLKNNELHWCDNDNLAISKETCCGCWKEWLLKEE